MHRIIGDDSLYRMHHIRQKARHNGTRDKENEVVMKMLDALSYDKFHGRTLLRVHPAGAVTWRALHRSVPLPRPVQFVRKVRCSGLHSNHSLMPCPAAMYPPYDVLQVAYRPRADFYWHPGPICCTLYIARIITTAPSIGRSSIVRCFDSLPSDWRPADKWAGVLKDIKWTLTPRHLCSTRCGGLLGICDVTACAGVCSL